MMWKNAVLAPIILSSLLAQEPEPTPPIEQWQYCSVQASRGFLNSDTGMVEARSQICTMTENGCQFSTVAVSEAPAARESGRPFQSLRLGEAVEAKALAQLGRQGWLMVQMYRSGDIEHDSRTFFLKRRLP